MKLIIEVNKWDNLGEDIRNTRVYIFKKLKILNKFNI